MHTLAEPHAAGPCAIKTPITLIKTVSSASHRLAVVGQAVCLVGVLAKVVCT
jgi:hypothetical protein